MIRVILLAGIPVVTRVDIFPLRVVRQYPFLRGRLAGPIMAFLQQGEKQAKKYGW